MDDMEDRIRVLLRDLAGDAPVLAEPPSGFRHETRMRRARSVLSTLVVLSLLAAAVIGARSFVRRVQVASSSCGTWTSEAVGFDGTIAAAVSFGDVIYAVGSEANGKGLSLLWDGKTWTRFDLPVGTRFTSIAGRSKNDVWAVGMRTDRSRNFSRPTKSGSISVSAPEPVVLHFDGTTWSVIPPMAEAAGLSVAVSPSGTVWIAESVTESVDRSATIV
ncbi:MAG TPA: hypothetical protein VI893_07350, partial [Thermoplasmata archaeon]|nr:hypothetical protein [Thermoplasmata archaeon]